MHPDRVFGDDEGKLFGKTVQYVIRLAMGGHEYLHCGIKIIRAEETITSFICG
jgi:hypothetical protein